MQSRARCPNRLHLKQATGVRRSSNGDIMMLPPPNVTLSDFNSTHAFVRSPYAESLDRRADEPPYTIHALLNGLLGRLRRGYLLRCAVSYSTHVDHQLPHIVLVCRP